MTTAPVLRTTLRALFDEAQSDVEMYRRPNLDSFSAAINPVLEALSMGNLGDDHIAYIHTYGEEFEIGTEYSCRGCAQTSEYRAPLAILDAEDPIKAAKIHRLEQKIAEANIQRSNYISGLAAVEIKLSQLNADLDAWSERA